MKLTALLLVMLMMVSSVLAQEYVKVGEEANVVFYIDKTSIKKEGELITFRGKNENATTVGITHFATNCKNYIVLFERYETADVILTRQKKKPEVSPVVEDTPIELAINYVCYNKIKKSIPGVSVPEAGKAMSAVSQTPKR